MSTAFQVAAWMWFPVWALSYWRSHVTGRNSGYRTWVPVIGCAILSTGASAVIYCLVMAIVTLGGAP